jgi:GNAT superfamily N-acetyltransferase
MDRIPIGADGCFAGPVGEGDRDELRLLFEVCEDHVRLHEGRAPTWEQVEELLRELPPGRTLADKYVLGIRGADHRLIGVIDVVRDYPASGEWYLGLLLLHPGERGRGLGERVYEAVEAWVRRRGGAAMWLAVLEQNPRARRFWKRLGFSAVTSRRVRLGVLESVAVRMVRRFGEDVEAPPA